jgi:hypothetical protein
MRLYGKTALLTLFDNMDGFIKLVLNYPKKYPYSDTEKYFTIDYD